MNLTIGFSPCPNDTFIFDALVNGKIDTKGISFDVLLEDVETLNQWSAKGKLDITKLSFNAFLQAVQQYALLHSGSALGKGVGPILVGTEATLANWQDEAWVNNARIAIPGYNTTANLLLSLAFPDATNKQEIFFNEIEAAVLVGAFDAGLIIHESRFTYEQKGLKKLIDLGDWWEKKENGLIPLGGIVIKRSFDTETARVVDGLVKESVAYAWQHYPTLAPFVTEHAQEMDEEVMRKHIELYVNDYSTDLGEEGASAVESLFDKALETGLITNLPSSIFY